MDVAYINAFLVSTSSVFDRMVKLPVALGKPKLKAPDDRLFKLFKVSACVDLSGANRGRVVISFSQPVALALASALAGVPVTALDEECMDALAEMSNMIVGGAKSQFPEQGTNCSVPTVLETRDVLYPSSLPVLQIPIDTSVGRFMIETALSPRKPRAAAATPAASAPSASVTTTASTTTASEAPAPEATATATDTNAPGATATQAPAPSPDPAPTPANPSTATPATAPAPSSPAGNASLAA